MDRVITSVIIIGAVLAAAPNQPASLPVPGGAGKQEAPCAVCLCDRDRVEGQMQLLATQLGEAVERIAALEAENAAMKAANREPEYRIVMYGADWCGPCHALKRTLDNAGIQYDYIDTTADESEAWRDLGVEHFPTLFLVENDVIQTGRKVVGSVSAATVRQSYPEVFQ